MISHSHPHSLRRSRAVERSPIFYGWVVWAVATLGIVASAPGQVFTISLFTDHYIEEFGIGRGMLSTLFGMGALIAALNLTWVGRRIDRFGNRRVGALAAAIFAVVLFLLAFISGAFTLFLSALALRLLGQGSMFLVSSTAIAQWWKKRRGWMMALALVTFALFQSGYLRVLQHWIDVHGWRMTWIILGACMAVLIVPVWWLLMRDRPEEYGLLPDAVVIPPVMGTGDINVQDADHDTELEEDNWTLAEARRTIVFWIFVAGRTFTPLFGTGLVFHQVSIITGQGHAESVVAPAYGLLAMVNALATLFIGRFINRWHPGKVLAVQVGVMMTMFFLAMHMQTVWMLQVYSVLFGCAMALGASFDGSVWADMFGRMHLGAIRGFVATIQVAGASVGPILFGFSYDQFGSYAPVLWMGITIGLIPLMMSLVVQRPVKRVDVAHA